MAANAFLFAGDVYSERFIGGVSQGLKGPFFAEQFEVQPDVDTKEKVSKGRSTYGQIIETVNINKPTKFKIKFSSVDKSTLAYGLLAIESAVTQGAATVTNEAVVAKLGDWVRLAKKSIVATTVNVTDGAATRVEGVDYKINYDLGMIQALAGGAIANNAALQVDYTHAALTEAVLAGSKVNEIRVRFILDGKNLVDEKPVELEVYEAVISAKTAMDFLNSDFAEVELEGTMKTPSGKTEPYVLKLGQ
jgi:hypothetical protein